MSSFQILIRWSLPRFRYDQVLSFAWKFMLPLAIANLTVTAVAVWALTRPVMEPQPTCARCTGTSPR